MTARRPPASLTHAELIADAIGYHAGRARVLGGPPIPCGYDPAAWNDQVARWFETPRGIEALRRMAIPVSQVLRGVLVEPDSHPFRWMPDGTPCWCISAEEPHEGWVHAAACQDLLRERLRTAIAALAGPGPAELAAAMQKIAEGDTPAYVRGYNAGFDEGFAQGHHGHTLGEQS